MHACAAAAKAAGATERGVTGTAGALVQSQSHMWLSRMGIDVVGRWRYTAPEQEMRRNIWNHATFARLSGEETSSFDSPRSSDTVYGACLAFLSR